jgi:chromosome segregation ATPase
VAGRAEAGAGWQADVAALHAALQAHEAELETLVEALARRDRTIRGLQAELHAKVGEANVVIGRLQAELDAIRRELDAIHRSRAWWIASRARVLRRGLR